MTNDTRAVAPGCVVVIICYVTAAQHSP
jgi:hypothetical protein